MVVVVEFVLLLAWLDERPIDLDGRVRADIVAPVKPGERTTVSLTILDDVQRKAPLIVWLKSDTVRLVENRLDWSDVIDPEAAQLRLEAVIFAPDDAGDHRVSSTVMYISCEKALCWPHWADASWTLSVHAQPPG